MHDLLKIAQRLYEEKGSRFTISEIAREAAVSRPVVYQELGDKSEILQLLSHPNERQPQSIEARVMRAILKVAGQSGFKEMKMEEVANEAEVGVATLFRRFGSKDDLIKYFVEHNAPRRFINDNQLSSYKGFAKLCHITSAMLGFMHKNRELVRLVIWGSADDQKYLRSLRNDGKSTSARLVEFFTEEINVGRLESEISPKNLAVQLFGMIQAHALLSDPEIFNLEQSQEAIVKMFSQFFKEQNDE